MHSKTNMSLAFAWKLRETENHSLTL